MATRAETFQQVTAAVQSIAVVIAALIGGWWALRTYVFEHPKFYEEGTEVAGVPITGTIAAEQLAAPSKSRVLSVRVILSHKSHLTELVRLSGNPVWAARIDSEKKPSSPVRGFAIQIDSAGNQSPRPTAAIPPGEQTSVVFAVPVTEPGLYLLQSDPCAEGRSVQSCLIQSHVAVH